MVFGGAPTNPFGATANVNPFGSFGTAATARPFGGVQASTTTRLPGQSGASPASPFGGFGRPNNPTQGVSAAGQASSPWNSTLNAQASSFTTRDTTQTPTTAASAISGVQRVENACSHWNNGRCRFGVRCRQRHVCAKCGSSAHRSGQCIAGAAASRPNAAPQFRPSRVTERINNGPAAQGTIQHVEAMAEHRGSSAEQLRLRAQTATTNTATTTNTNNNDMAARPTSWPGVTTTPLVSTPAPGPNPFARAATTTATTWPAPQTSTPAGAFTFNPTPASTPAGAFTFNPTTPAPAPAPAPAAVPTRNPFTFPAAATNSNPFNFTPTTAPTTTPVSASGVSTTTTATTTAPAASPFSTFTRQSAPTQPATQPATSHPPTFPSFTLTPPAQTPTPTPAMTQNATSGTPRDFSFVCHRPPRDGPQVTTQTPAPTLFPNSTNPPPDTHATVHTATHVASSPPKVNSSPYGKPLESSNIVSAPRQVFPRVPDAASVSAIASRVVQNHQLPAWATQPRRVYLSRAPLPTPSRLALRPRGTQVRRAEWMLQPASKPRELFIRSDVFESRPGVTLAVPTAKPAPLSIAVKDESVDPFILTESAKADGYSCEFKVEDRKLRDFGVTRDGFGSVRWLQPVDVTHLNGADIARVVRIERGAVYVYEEASGVSAPRSGEGLKTRAEVTLLDVRSKKDTEASRKRFEAKVVQQTRRMGAELLEYNLDTGTWRFVIEL